MVTNISNDCHQSILPLKSVTNIDVVTAFQLSQFIQFGSKLFSNPKLAINDCDIMDQKQAILAAYVLKHQY